MSQTSSTRGTTERLRRAQSTAAEMLREVTSSSLRVGEQLASLTDVLVPASRAAGGRSRSAPCCPPDVVCPPACMLTITRRAHPGEIILVPFKIRNSSGRSRTYRLGLREMKDQHGNTAPSQPTLNTTTLHLDPHEERLVEMRIDLTTGYSAGRSFDVTVVVREQKYNQNICFVLHLDPFSNVPVAEPIEEERIDVHFVGWDKHFYCEPPARTGRVTVRPAGEFENDR